MLQAFLEEIEASTETCHEPQEAKIKNDLEEVEAAVEACEEVLTIMGLEANLEAPEEWSGRKPVMKR